MSNETVEEWAKRFEAESKDAMSKQHFALEFLLKHPQLISITEQTSFPDNLIVIEVASNVAKALSEYLKK